MRKVVIVGLVLGIVVMGGTATTSFAAQKTLKVGTMGPLSGPAASWGWDLVRALTIKVEEINAAGGLKVGQDTYKIEIVYYDHKARADEATTITKKLIFGDKVKYIIGNGIGATCDAAQLITEPNKILFTFTCWGPKILGPDKPYSFRQLLSALEAYPVMYDYVHKKNPNIKTLAIVNPNDTSGWDSAKGAKRGAKQENLEVVADVYYERGTQDFGPIVSKLLVGKPDLIELGGSPPGDAGLITKGLHERGYKGVKAYAACITYEPYLKVAGAAAEGTYMGVGWDLEGALVRPGVIELAKRMKERYKEPMGVNGVTEYAAAQMVFGAMEKTGSLDVDKIIEYWLSHKMETILGPIVIGGKEDYGINRQFLYPMVSSVVEGGKVINKEESLPFQLR